MEEQKKINRKIKNHLYYEKTNNHDVICYCGCKVKWFTMCYGYHAKSKKHQEYKLKNNIKKSDKHLSPKNWSGNKDYDEVQEFWAFLTGVPYVPE